MLGQLEENLEFVGQELVTSLLSQTSGGLLRVASLVLPGVRYMRCESEKESVASSGVRNNFRTNLTTF